MNRHALDDKQRRRALILLGVVGLMLAVLLWPVARPKPRRISQVPRQNARQPGGGTAAPLRRAPAAPARDAGMLGKWQANGLPLLRRGGLCSLWVELARNPRQPDSYTGAATLSCTPTTALTDSKPGAVIDRLASRLQPLSASLSGAWEKDAITFRVDKLLNGGECGLTGISVSKFGSANVTAEFHDACGGGAAVMRKVG